MDTGRIEDDAAQESSREEPARNEDSRTSPPPFYIRFKEAEWSDFVAQLENAATGEVNVRSIDNDSLLEVTVDDYKDYEVLQPLVETYVVPSPKGVEPKSKTTTAKALLKGLPWLCDEAMVQRGLHQTGFCDVFVRLHNRTNRKKPPLFILAVTTAGNHHEKKEAEKIFELHKLLGFKIQVEPLPPGMDSKPQCYKCQEEGHVAKHCRNEPRCVKCAGKHASRACQVRKEEKPTCARCNGTHVASWRGCKAFANRKRPETVRPSKEESTRGGTTMRRHRRRRRHGKATTTPPEEDIQNTTYRRMKEKAPTRSRPTEEIPPPTRPASPTTSDRGGEGNGRRRLKRNRPTEESPLPTRPTSPTISDRGGEGDGRRRLKRNHTTGDHQILTTTTAEEEEGVERHANIEAALQEAESRFRMALHSEMEAACLLIREAYRRQPQLETRAAQTDGAVSASKKTQTTVQNPQEERGIQTDEEIRPEKKQKKKVVTNRGTQTESRYPNAEKTTEIRHEECQTTEIITMSGNLLNTDVMKEINELNEARYGTTTLPATGKNLRYQINWLEYRHTPQYKKEQEEKRREEEEEQRREEEENRRSGHRQNRWNNHQHHR